MLKILKIESSKVTPSIVLNPNNNTFEFSGYSLPEDVIEFYRPVFEWLNNYINELNDGTIICKELNIIFKFEYYNTASLRQIVEIFNKIHKIQQIDIPVNVTWQYDSEDTQMAEAGKELSIITKVPVNIVSY